MTEPTPKPSDLRTLPDPNDPRATAEAILFEIRRVIVGQDAMLERLLVALEGLTPSQAAQVCGVSGEAMRQRLSRGRVMLAERLRRTEEPLTVLKEVRP